MALKFKDIKAKIGSKKEALWSKVLAETELMIKEQETNLIINKAMRDLAKSKIKKHRL